MTTRAEEIAGEWYPDTTGPDGEIIYMEGQRQVFVNGYKQGQRDRWIGAEDESKLPPIHQEPFAEDGFVLILLQCADWPGKYKTMKASRTIGDWSEDGTSLWFWTDEEGEIIDDDDNLITHWMPIPQPPNPEQR